MAKVEADREDLMREAVALVRRMELVIEGQTVLVGFRATGWFSVYFDADPMYQFDELGRLRRAFVAGLLYRTQGNVLAQLQRQRTDTETTLLRRDLSGESLDDFREDTHVRIRWLQGQLQTCHVDVRQQVPVDDSDLRPDVQRFLETVLNSTQFLAPAINEAR